MPGPLITDPALDGLTAKQAAFVVDLAKTGDGVHAAKEAKYKGSNAQLARIARNNLLKNNVATALAALTEKRAVTRQGAYSEEIADSICTRIAGGESLRTICSDPDLPHIATVLRWVDANEAFRQQYTRAREAQADKFAEEIVDIADQCEDPAKARVQIDARKWLAGKMRPKTWGDTTPTAAVQVNVDNSDRRSVYTNLVPPGPK